MQTVPFLFTMIQGAIGKRFVVKHYKTGKIVVTKYPDMSRVVPSERQRARRQLFREAVVYARWIFADAKRKQAFRQTLPKERHRRVFQAAIQFYMRMQGDKQWLQKQLALQAMERVQQGDRPLASSRGQGRIGKGRLALGKMGMVGNKEQGVQGNWQGVMGVMPWAVGEMGIVNRCAGGKAMGCREWATGSRQGIEKRIRSETEKGIRWASLIQDSESLAA